MANNNTQIISRIITRLDKKIIDLEAKEHINVSMRIDEIVPFLKGVLVLAKDDRDTSKFDLVEDKTGSCSIAYTVDGESTSAGSNVLRYGDTLVISVTPSTGYTITKLQVNGKDYVSGTEIFVDTDIKLEVVATLNTYNLTITPAEHSTISVKRNGEEVDAGTGVISYGDSLFISSTANEGYTIISLNINGEDYLGDQTITVTGNVAVETTVIANDYDLTITPDANCSIAVTRDGNSVSAGTDVITAGDVLTIIATAGEGYEIATLQVNGEDFTNGNSLIVSGDVTVVATSQAVL